MLGIPPYNQSMNYQQKCFVFTTWLHEYAHLIQLENLDDMIHQDDVKADPSKYLEYVRQEVFAESYAAHAFMAMGLPKNEILQKLNEYLKSYYGDRYSDKDFQDEFDRSKERANEDYSNDLLECGCSADCDCGGNIPSGLVMYPGESWLVGGFTGYPAGDIAVTSSDNIELDSQL